MTTGPLPKLQRFWARKRTQRISQSSRTITKIFGIQLPNSCRRRASDGRWVEHFDPKLGGGQGGRDYTTEVNSWLYTFSVQHDPEGLIQLMGGRDVFNARLDQLFIE